MATYEKMSKYVFGAIVALTVGPMALATVNAQVFEDSWNVDTRIEYVNDDVSDVTHEMDKFGFTFGEWVPFSEKLTLSGYNIEPTLTEDIIANITAEYNFELIDFDMHSNGGYVVLQYNGTMISELVL